MLKLQNVTAMGKCSNDVQINYFLVPLPCLDSCLSAELWMRDAKLSAGIWPPCFSDWVLMILALSSWDGGFFGMSLLLLDMVGYDSQITNRATILSGKCYSFLCTFFYTFTSRYTFQITAIISLESMCALPQKTLDDVSWLSEGNPKVPSSAQI